MIAHQMSTQMSTESGYRFRAWVGKLAGSPDHLRFKDGSYVLSRRSECVQRLFYVNVGQFHHLYKRRISWNNDPLPIDTTNVQLDEEILELTERLAKNAHDNWARQRVADGWRHGPRRDQDKKEHPSLVPYEKLSEEEKEYDRNAAMETLKAMLALGYRIDKAS
jgi:hypothetical protein